MQNDYLLNFQFYNINFKTFLPFVVGTSEEQQPRQQVRQQPHQLLLPKLPVVITTLRAHGQICITKCSTALAPKVILSPPPAQQCSSPGAVPGAAWAALLRACTCHCHTGMATEQQGQHCPRDRPSPEESLPCPTLCMERLPQPIRIWGQLPAS